METTEDVLAGVGPRLRRLRQERNVTLAALADTTGISVSTLSRLESGKRRPSLELLLPLAQAHQVPLDELVGAPNVGDPRIRPRPQRMNDMIVLPLTRRPGGVQAFKMIIPERLPEPDPRVHEGYEWLYVLNGRLRLHLAGRDLVLEPGRPRSSTPGCRTGSAAPAGPSRCSACSGRRGAAAPARPAATVVTYIGYPCIPPKPLASLEREGRPDRVGAVERRRRRLRRGGTAPDVVRRRRP